ncbi:MAG: hypothetical protein AB7N80_02570 [Bdellovibrionales bacterium]
MKTKAWAGTILLTFILIAGYSNCSRARMSNSRPNTLENTSTIGNPMQPTVNKIMSAICTAITTCHTQVSQSQCEIGIFATTGFAAPLGLAPAYDTMERIGEAEVAGTLIGNSTSTSNCSQQVQSLSCSSTEVQNAYQPMLSNPFAEAAAIALGSSCNQVYAPGISLEVPIELVDAGLASQTANVTFARTRTSLNTADYDGTVTYDFEVVAINQDAVARSVSLIDSSGSGIATISVAANLTEPTMIRTVATPTSGANNYRVQIQGTSANEQLEIFSARLFVRQRGATRTKIYIPLIGGYSSQTNNQDNFSARVDQSTFLNYNLDNNGHYFALWRKVSAAFQELDDSPWTFEAVLSAGNTGDSMYAALYNMRTQTHVPASQLVSTSTSPTLVSTSFSDSASSFSDLDYFGVRLRRDIIGSNGAIYRAGLWVKLTNLQHAEVYYRNATTISRMGANAQPEYFNPIRLDLTRFSAPTQVHMERTGYQFSGNPPCATQTLDIGANNSGQAGPAVANSLLTFTTTTKTLRRSAPLVVTSGHAYIQESQQNQSSDACVIPQSLFVIGF